MIDSFSCILFDLQRLIQRVSLMSPILKVDVICDIVMTSTQNVLTAELRDLLYNQCIYNTYSYSFFIYPTGRIRVCKIRFVSMGENRGKHWYARIRVSYMSGHFIWSLWNRPPVNFIWNNHKFRIMFIIQLFKQDFYDIKRQNSNSKHNIATDGFVTLSVSNQILYYMWSYSFYDIT